MKIITCPDCEGTKRAAHPRAGESIPCFGCNGHGLRRASGMAYKTVAQARRYGVTCTLCEGTGTYTFPTGTACSSCSQSGVRVVDAHPGDVLPVEVGSCDHIRGELAASLASQWRIVVRREDRGLTWGESYLGLGSLWSCTDYGRAWEADDDNLAELVRGQLASEGTQWVRVVDPGDRAIVSTILIKLTRNGYRVCGAVETSRPVLPPAYTAELLDRPL